MPERLRKTLADAISEVMETMFFLCPEPCQAENGGAGKQGGEEPGGAQVIVQIRAADERLFRIVLKVPSALLRIMAANVLDGPQEERTRKDLEDDMACELANMVAGAFLNRLDEPRRKPLSIPAILAAVPAGEWMSYSCEVEGERLTGLVSCRCPEKGAAG
ncbi:MAG: chemotaxis protein CheX [bacterium]